MKLARDIKAADLEALGFVQEPSRQYLYCKGPVSVGLLHTQSDGQERLSVYLDGPTGWTVEFTNLTPAAIVMATIKAGLGEASEPRLVCPQCERLGNPTVHFYECEKHCCELEWRQGS
jgi:hypothetical protein